MSKVDYESRDSAHSSNSHAIGDAAYAIGSNVAHFFEDSAHFASRRFRYSNEGTSRPHQTVNNAVTDALLAKLSNAKDASHSLRFRYKCYIQIYMMNINL